MAIDYAAAQTWDKDGSEQALMSPSSAASPSLAGCSRGFAARANDRDGKQTDSKTEHSWKVICKVTLINATMPEEINALVDVPS